MIICTLPLIHSQSCLQIHLHYCPPLWASTAKPFLRTCQLESPPSHLTSKTTLSSSLHVSLSCSPSPWSPASCFRGHPPSFFQKLHSSDCCCRRWTCLVPWISCNSEQQQQRQKMRPLSIFSSHLRKVIVQQLSNRMFALS